MECYLKLILLLVPQKSIALFGNIIWLALSLNFYKL